MNRLLEKIPTFLQPYREYIKITEAEIPEFDGLEIDLKDLYNAQFIFKCPEKWFKQLYEEPLHLSTEGMTIDERRVKVYNLYNNAIPYNKTTINNRVYIIVPEEHCTIIRKPHKVTIKLDSDYFNKKDIIKELLDSVIPLNMVIEIRLNAITHGRLKIFKHGDLKRYTHGQIKTLEV